MENYIIVLFWILVLMVILSSIPIKEGYHNFFGYSKQYCPSCGWRSMKSCKDCINCGICTTANGVSSCSLGDQSGPYYRNDCAYWDYGNQYNYYQNAIAYPVVTTRDRYPYNRWGKNRPYGFYRKN